MFWFPFELFLYVVPTLIHVGVVYDVYGNVYGNSNLVPGWLVM